MMNIKYELLLSVIFLNTFIATAQWEVQNIDANNISAPVEADGCLFLNSPTDQHFEVPKFSGKHCIYASNLWMGGLDQNGNLHLAAQTYKQNGTDYWPAPLTTNGSTLPASTWNKVWHLDRSIINNHIANYNTQGYQMPQDITDWPGSTFNGVSQIFAPFVDVNNNGVYDPSYGDYPNVLGDETLYLMYNDKFASHGESGAVALEAEIYTTVYSYNSTGSVILDNTIFVRHRIRNRSQLYTYNNFYAGIWNDFDIGDYADDLIGTDINRNMVYGYNADNFDSIYGSNPPAAGMKILNHNLSNSMFYNNTGSNFYGNNPTNPNHFYNYLRSLWKDDTPLNYGLEGYQTPFGSTKFCFSGNTNPNFSQSWDMTAPADYRIMGSVGPFTIAPNGFITIDLAYIYAKGTSENGLSELGIAADVVQNFYTASINSIEEESAIYELKISPNPAQDFIYISSNYLINNEVRIEIYDIAGMLVQDEIKVVNNHFKVDISALKAGIYFLCFRDKNGVRNQKFVKN